MTKETGLVITVILWTCMGILYALIYFSLQRKMEACYIEDNMLKYYEYNRKLHNINMYAILIGIAVKAIEVWVKI